MLTRSVVCETLGKPLKLLISGFLLCKMGLTWGCCVDYIGERTETTEDRDEASKPWFKEGVIH